MKSQFVFQAVLGCLSAVGIPLSLLIHRRNVASCANGCPKLEDFWVSLVFGAGFVAARYAFVWLAAPLGRWLVVRGKMSDRVYALKLKRFTHNFFQLLYFTLVTYLAYRILQDQPFFPKEFGGDGSVTPRLSVAAYRASQSLSRLIDASILVFIKHYFFLSVGFHLASVYFLVVGGDYHHMHFWETCVQVVLAFELIVLGYAAQHFAIGAMLMFIHDACDVLTSGCKALVDTSYKVTAFMGALILMTVWAYGRLFCLGKLILVPILQDIERTGIRGNAEEALFAVLLLCLFFMNIYWYATRAAKHFI